VSGFEYFAARTKLWRKPASSDVKEEQVNGVGQECPTHTATRHNKPTHEICPLFEQAYDSVSASRESFFQGAFSEDWYACGAF
jgi:hypothetical protein